MEEIRFNLDENRNYEISNYGVVYSKNKGVPLKISKWGVVVITCDGKRVHYRVDKLVAKYFIPMPPPNRKFLRHIDGDRLNNREDNLVWSDCRNKKYVVVTTPNGEILKFGSMKEAAAHFGTKQQSFSTCVMRNGHYKKHKIDKIRG